MLWCNPNVIITFDVVKFCVWQFRQCLLIEINLSRLFLRKQFLFKSQKFKKEKKLFRLKRGWRERWSCANFREKRFLKRRVQVRRTKEIWQTADFFPKKYSVKHLQTFILFTNIAYSRYSPQESLHEILKWLCNSQTLFKFWKMIST